MQRTNVIELKPRKTQKKVFKELMFLSSCVYNSTNYIVRQQFFKNEKISSFFDLQQQMQRTDDYQLLGRSYSLPRIQIYGETNSARFKLIKSQSQKRVGLPKYFKNRKTNTTIPSYLAIDGCQYSVKKHHVLIPLSRQMRKKYNIKHFRIPYNGVLKWCGKQQRGQIKFKDGKLYLYQSVELKEPKLINSKTQAGLDLGIKKIFGLFVNNGFDGVIGSKRFFKQYEHYTKLIAKEQQKLSEINRKTSIVLKRLYEKRSKWQNNLFDNLVAKLFRVLRNNNVSVLHVGNIKHIRDSGSKGRIINRMINNYWSFGKLYCKLCYKAEEFGIELKYTTEEYTSKTCPFCGEITKPKGRLFICSYCGHFEHRDILGAKNIYSKSRFGSILSGLWDEAVPCEVSS